MNISVYLKEKSKESKRATIMIYLTHGKERYRISSGISIPTEFWDSKKQKVKSSFSGSVEYNGIILKKISDLQQKFSKALDDNGKFSWSLFKESLKPKIVNDKIKEGHPKPFNVIVEEFINHCMLTKGNAVIKSYKTTYNHLKSFGIATKKKISLETFDKEFYDIYVNYLANTHNLTNNSIGKDIKNIKVLLRWTTDEGYNNNLAYLKYKVLEEESDPFILREDELLAIESLDLSYSARLSRVRDLYLMMVYTSLRVSDLLKLSPANFDLTQGLLRVTATKTRGEQYIAITLKLDSILIKYPDLNFPRVTSQEINRCIKEIGKMAGMTELFQVVKYSGRKKIVIEKPRYQFLTSKIGRRTNITFSLKANVPESIVRRQSGHKTLKHFNKYIKMSGDDVINAMKNVEIWK
jgi:integrase